MGGGRRGASARAACGSFQGTPDMPRTKAGRKDDEEEKKPKLTAEQSLRRKIERGREKKALSGRSDGKYRMGYRTQIEIEHYQMNTELLIPRVSFQRVVRDLCHQVHREMHRPMRMDGQEDAEEPPDADAPVGIRFESQAMVALQEAAENYLVGLFEDSNACAVHA